MSVTSDDYVITNRQYTMISVDTASRWTAKFFDEHGWTNIRLHSLRHTFAAVLVRSNMHIETIREIMGHQDIRTTQIYMYNFQIREEGLMAAVNAFNISVLEAQEEHPDEDYAIK